MKSAHLHACRRGPAGYEVALDGKMLENVERIAAEAAEHCTAPPVGVGLKDLDHDARRTRC